MDANRSSNSEVISTESNDYISIKVKLFDFGEMERVHQDYGVESDYSGRLFKDNEMVGYKSTDGTHLVFNINQTLVPQT